MNKIFSKHLLKYMIVGGIATIVDITIFKQLVSMLHIDYRVALVGGFTGGVFINFILCNAFIFERTSSFWHACFKHYCASFGGLVLNQLGMILLISGLQFPHLVLSRIIVATATFVINFWLIKTFTFNN